MTTSTPRANRADPIRHPVRPVINRAGFAAFTLSEVIIATSLSSLLLAGILSTFLFIGRTGLNAASYSEMNGKLRNALERFSRDVHLATDLRWTDQRRLTLVLPADLGSSVTYAYEAATDGTSLGRFIRQIPGSAPETLVGGISPDFAFARYRLPVSAWDEPPIATNDFETKQLEVRLRAVRAGAQTPAVSQLSTSARCLLRNKAVGL